MFGVRNVNNVIIAHININSIRNRIDLLTKVVRGNIDILTVSETKKDDTFPTGQFIIWGFTTLFRFDRTDDGRCILVYIREDIPSKMLKTPYIYDHTEYLTIKINLRKTKWLHICSYNPLKSNIVYHLNSLGKIPDHIWHNMIEFLW